MQNANFLQQKLALYEILQRASAFFEATYLLENGWGLELRMSEAFWVTLMENNCMSINEVQVGFSGNRRGWMRQQ